MKAFFTSLKAFIGKCDLLLLAIAMSISAIGLTAIYSATSTMSKISQPKLMIVQTGAMILGILAFFIISLVDLDRFGDLWPVAFVLNLILLLSLRFLGESGDTGNRSWIRFAGIGIQPAEIGKIIFIFTFARHIYTLRDNLNTPRALIQLILHAMTTAGFVYIFSGDLGMCLVYLMIFIIMLFASGLSMKYFLPLCGLGAASLYPLWHYVLADYHKLRIIVLFDPEASPKIAYNGIQSMIAVGGGEMFGYGYMNGPQTQYNILPSKHTDFIFSSICEEWGFVGGMVVIILLTILVWRILYDASQAYDRFSYLVCIGIGGMLMSQILINVGMCLGIMPVIGITLPFVSYGGTSMATTFMALGLVNGLKMRERPGRLR